MEKAMSYLISKDNKKNIGTHYSRGLLQSGYIIQTADYDMDCVVMKKDFSKVENIFPNKKYVKNRLEEAEIGVLISTNDKLDAGVALLDDYNEDLTYFDRKWSEYDILYIYPLDIDITNPKNFNINNLNKSCHNKKNFLPLWRK